MNPTLVQLQAFADQLDAGIREAKAHPMPSEPSPAVYDGPMVVTVAPLWVNDRLDAAVHDNRRLNRCDHVSLFDAGPVLVSLPDLHELRCPECMHELPGLGPIDPANNDAGLDPATCDHCGRAGVASIPVMFVGGRLLLLGLLCPPCATLDGGAR
ncbi:hypothetical protein [Kineococcus sp. SYSU DK006]|uniref:hypothetical protein n=1 Tax=Kineococcus sp. SYSU DK006 TaxID=3383127 RepID=UPI003D7C41B6